MTAEIWGDSSKIRFRVQWVGVFIVLSLALLLMRVLDTTIRMSIMQVATPNHLPFCARFQHHYSTRTTYRKKLRFRSHWDKFFPFPIALELKRPKISGAISLHATVHLSLSLQSILMLNGSVIRQTKLVCPLTLLIPLTRSSPVTTASSPSLKVSNDSSAQ